WYLRGRIEPDSDQAEPYLQHAIRIDPKLAWPWLALAARAASQARWNDCLSAAQKAKKLELEDPDVLDEYVHIARLARGEAATLVEEYRSCLSSTMPKPAALF